MSDNPAQQVLDELFPYFEALKAQTAAILQFLRDKGIATEEQLTPYFEQARDASNVKWHAARVRMEHLFSSQPQGMEKSAVTATKADQKEGAEGGSTRKLNAATENDAAKAPKKDREDKATSDEEAA